MVADAPELYSITNAPGGINLRRYCDWLVRFDRLPVNSHKRSRGCGNLVQLGHRRFAVPPALLPGPYAVDKISVYPRFLTVSAGVWCCLRRILPRQDID